MAQSTIPTNEQLKKIELVVMDVDGVMTTGEICYTTSGEEIKTFNVKDGHGITLWNHYGLKTAIITARDSEIVARRAKELGIQHIFQGAKQKLATLTALCETLSLSLEQVCYIGDDWPDLGPLQAAGLAVCPHDAVPEVQAASHWILSSCGGRGAVRELFNALILARGLALK